MISNTFKKKNKENEQLNLEVSKEVGYCTYTS